MEESQGRVVVYVFRSGCDHQALAPAAGELEMPFRFNRLNGLSSL